MNQTIRGTYDNGTITLDRVPEGVTRAHVVVEFVETPEAAEPELKRIRFGVFRPADGQYTSDEAIEETKKSLNPKWPE